MTFLGGHVQSILGHNLLSLPERNVVEILVVDREAQLVPQGLHILERINSRA